MTLVVFVTSSVSRYEKRIEKQCYQSFSFTFASTKTLSVEIIPFIKNLLIDSLAGISFRNLTFIVLQLVAGGLAVLLYLKISKQKVGFGKITALGVAFTTLFIIAFTSVPLSILAGFLVLAFLLRKPANTKEGQGFPGEQGIVVLLLSYAAGSGHLILLALSLLVIFLFYRFLK